MFVLEKNSNWGLARGECGSGIGDWAQSPIPNPQSPIPNPQKLCIGVYNILINKSKNELYFERNVLQMRISRK